MDEDALGSLIIGLFAGFIMGAVLGTLHGRHQMRREAVDIGHAEYVMDPKTGDVDWRWKP